MFNKWNINQLNFVVLYLLLALNYQRVTQSASSEHKQQPDEQKLNRLCRVVSSMKNISQMQELIDVVRKLVDSNSNQPQTTSFKLSCNNKELWLANTYPVQVCLRQAEAILSLDPIIGERENVCKKSHIDKIRAYRRQFIINQKVKLTRPFFTLYAEQVSFICKRNLLSSLNKADKSLFTEQDYQVIRPETSSDRSRTDDQLAGHLEGQDENSKSHCAESNPLTCEKSINELAQVLRDDEATTTGNQEVQDIVLKTTQSLRVGFQTMFDVCVKFEKVYVNTVSPIVRLAQMGFDARYDRFDEKSREDKMMQLWFNITLVCDSVLRVHLSDLETIQKDSANQDENKPIVVDVAEHSQLPQRNQDPPEFLKNPIEDELWIGKYLPAKMSILRSEFVNYLTKVSRLDKLFQNVAFRKGLRWTKRSLITIVIIGLTLLGMNSS